MFRAYWQPESAERIVSQGFSLLRLVMAGCPILFSSSLGRARKVQRASALGAVAGPECPAQKAVAVRCNPGVEPIADLPDAGQIVGIGENAQKWPRRHGP